MKRLSFIFLSITATFISFAQVEDHAKWKYSVEKISDKQLRVVSTASLDPGWQIYSSNMQDGGPQKTIVTVEPSNMFTVSGSTTDSGKLIEKFDSSFNITLRYFPNIATFKKTIDLTDTTVFMLKGNVLYMLCTELKLSGLNGVISRHPNSISIHNRIM